MHMHVLACLTLEIVRTFKSMRERKRKKKREYNTE